MPAFEQFPVDVDFEQRTPEVLSPVDVPYVEAADREWVLTTEAVRRDSLTNPDVRDTLVGFIDTPVSQNTAGNMLKVLDEDDRAARLARRTGSNLLKLLKVNEVPEQLITPDIANSSTLHTVAEDTANHQRWGYSEAAHTKALRDKSELGMYAEGLTEAERTVISRKYAYARDVMLLAFGAELAQNGGVELSETYEATLPSGVHIQADPKLGDRAVALLDPSNWVSRKQLKDRVYTVEAGGEDYIMKERKTDRHTDTKEGGHRDGLTAAQEYATGKNLHDNFSKTEGLVSLAWEEPLGYVEYPNDFQFGLFKCEKDLISHTPTDILRRRIVDNRSEFEAEYEVIAKKAKEFEQHPLTADAFKQGPKLSLWQKFRGVKLPEPEVSFEDFAAMKARRIADQSRELYRDTVREAGYENSDIDGFAYKVPSDGSVGLQIIGFDYEYFTPISKERATRLKSVYDEYNNADPHNAVNWSIDDTAQEKAVYLALLEAEGKLPESIKNMQN